MIRPANCGISVLVVSPCASFWHFLILNYFSRPLTWGQLAVKFNWPNHTASCHLMTPTEYQRRVYVGREFEETCINMPPVCMWFYTENSSRGCLDWLSATMPWKGCSSRTIENDKFCFAVHSFQFSKLKLAHFGKGNITEIQWNSKSSSNSTQKQRGSLQFAFQTCGEGLWFTQAEQQKHWWVWLMS